MDGEKKSMMPLLFCGAPSSNVEPNPVPPRRLTVETFTLGPAKLTPKGGEENGGGGGGR